MNILVILFLHPGNCRIRTYFYKWHSWDKEYVRFKVFFKKKHPIYYRDTPEEEYYNP